MRITLLVLSISLLSVNSFAQFDTREYIETKVYNNVTAYKKNTPKDVLMYRETRSDLGTLGDIDYLFYGTKREWKKKRVHESVWAIEHNNQLYINCSIIRYKYFSPALYRNNKYIYFRGYMSRLEGHEIQMRVAGKKAMGRAQGHSDAATMGVLFGVAGAVASELPKDIRNKSMRYNYMIDLNTGWVHVMDIMFMQKLLAHKPELNYQYMEEGHPEDVASMIRFLQAAFDE